MLGHVRAFCFIVYLYYIQEQEIMSGNNNNTSQPQGPSQSSTSQPVRAPSDSAAVDNQSQIDAIIARSAEREKALNEIYKERKTLLGKMAEARNEALNSEQQILTTMNILVNQSKERNDETTAILADQITKMETLTDLRKAELIADLESAETAQQQLDIIQEQVGKMQDIQNTQKEIAKISNKVSQRFGLIADTSDSFLGNLGEMVNKLKVMNAEQGFGGVAASLASGAFEAFGLQKIMASIVEMSIKLALELDKSSKAFGAKTGMDIAGLSDQFLEVTKFGVSAGVTIGDASQAYADLSENLSNFSTKNKAANVSMVKTISLLNKMGVQASASAKSIDIMTTAMGKTTKSAEMLTTRIATMGKSIDVSGTKMISQFNDSAGDLIEFGPKMESVFKNLAIQAKLTGISMSKLISTSKKFDTFEGATSQVAQMNAILGTNLSSMEMLNMTHDERIARMREEVKASVGNFNALDRYEQKYIAQAMGLESVDAAARLLNMSQSEYLQNQSKMKASAQTQADLAKIVENYVPVLEKLKLSMMELVVTFDPAIKSFVSFFQLLADNKEIVKWLVGTLLLAHGALILLGSSMGFAGAKSQLIFLAIGALIMLAGKLYEFWNNDKTSFVLAITVMAIGLAVLIFIFRKLNKQVEKTGFWFKLLKTIFGSKINPLFINAFGWMAVGVRFLANALKGMNAQASIGAIALALLFGSVALLVYSLADFIRAIGELFTIFINSVDLLPKVATGMYLIAGAMLALGAASMISASSLLIFMTGLGAISAIVAIATGVSALSSLGESMDKIGNGMQSFAAGLKEVIKLSSSMSKISEKAFMAFSSKGSETSAVIASNDLIKTAVSGKIKVDVNIPEIKSPVVNLSVYLNGFKLDTSDSDIARVVVEATR
jgi:hypothetical protein